MIFDMLKEHQAKEKASFHMPGHKNARGFSGTFLADNPFAYDTTELCGTDALIQPTGAILEAEQMAASIYGAAHSFFLVNGSTVGILAMIYAAFCPGDVVLVDRYCHQSVLHACELAGVQPVYLTPSGSQVAGIPGTLSQDAVAQGFAQFPEAKGLIITSPNYYGKVADLAAISQLVHHHGGVLLVDEAHGAHFPFSDRFPKTAMEQGADLSVTSLHKSLNAPNQTALLHIGTGFQAEELRRVLRMFQTSSPSYVLLAAMERALCEGKEQGADKTEQLIQLIEPLGCPSLGDPFKLLPSWQAQGLSGHEADAIFREKFGIYAELATEHGLLLMCSWHNTKEDFALLHEAIRYCDGLPKKDSVRDIDPQLVFKPVMARCALSELRQKESQHVSLERAEGRICAGVVTAFPPCIPILLPGEIVTAEQIATIKRLHREGATITGMESGIKVI